MVRCVTVDMGLPKWWRQGEMAFEHVCHPAQVTGVFPPLVKA